MDLDAGRVLSCENYFDASNGFGSPASDGDDLNVFNTSSGDTTLFLFDGTDFASIRPTETFARIQPVPLPAGFAPMLGGLAALAAVRGARRA